MDNYRQKKVAILFFGLTRSLKDVYSSLKTNIFDVLTDNNIEYDIFIHTYALPNPYTNPYINTKINDYDNESYKFLNPKYYIIENQNKVENKLKVSKYFAKLSDWAGCAPTFEKKCFFVRNMVLAQHSKKMVTNLFKEYQSNYDYVMFTRPDQALHTKINPSVFNLLNNNNIIIPKEHSYLGVNDRLCLAKPNIGIIYGNTFNSLLAYSKQRSIISEVFLKKYLQFNNIQIIYSPITATLIRI
jgi:hypothetical protein